MADEPPIGERLARIEERLSELVRLNSTRGEDHEQRIRALEVKANRGSMDDRWKYALPLSLVGTLIASLVAIFGRG